MVKTALTLALTLSAAALCHGTALAQTIDAQQARSMAASCAGCHGTNGAAQPGMVTLAGTNAAAMTAKLLDFKAGKITGASSTIMHQLAKGYSDAQLGAIATYFSTQKAP